MNVVPQAGASATLTRLPRKMRVLCHTGHTSPVSGLSLADSVTAHRPRPPVCGASCSAVHTRLGGEAQARPAWEASPPQCKAAVLTRAPAKPAQRRWGNVGPRTQARAWGTSVRSPKQGGCPGKAVEGHMLQAERTVRAEGRSDVFRRGLHCGWSERPGWTGAGDAGR